jgi:hypothetical protein
VSNRRSKHPGHSPGKNVGVLSSTTSRLDRQRIGALNATGPQELEAFRLPGPQDTKGPKYLAGDKLVVDLYLRTIGQLLYFADNPPGRIPKHRSHIKWGLRLMWSLMRDARLFSIPTRLYEAYHESVGQQVAAVADDEAQVKRLVTAATLPERMPFDTCYLGLDIPAGLTPELADAFGLPVEKVASHWLYGFLVYRQGDGSEGAVAFFSLSYADSGAVAVPAPLYGPMLHDEQIELEGFLWANTGTLTWGVVPLLIEWINSHQTLISDKTKSLSYRTQYKRGVKAYGAKPIPPPYYTVTMRDQTIEDAKRDRLPRAPRRKCQHRYDIRGALKMRTAYGKLPIPAKIEKALRKDPRRLIFTTEQPPGFVCEALARRGKPQKRKDEWMAVLPFWKKPGMGGDPNGPYIPALRKSARAAEPELAAIADRKSEDGDNE